MKKIDIILVVFLCNLKYTELDGFLSYYEICEKLKEGWIYSQKENLPYAYSKNEWISYEDVESMKLKVHL